MAGEVTPTRNEAAPPPGQLGLGFQKTKRLAAAVLTSTDVGRAGKMRQARVGARGAAARPPALALPGLELERQRREECLNTALRRERSCRAAVVISDQAS